MHCLIITGGNHPGIDRVSDIVRAADLIIAADSGLDTAIAYGIRVHECIGDGDSVLARIEDHVLRHAIRIHPREKGLTDTELCLERAAELGYEEIILIGGGEGRLDHTVSLLQLYAAWPYPKRWYTAHEVVYAVEGFERFEVEPGMKVSVFNICQKDPVNVSSVGLRWELEGYPISSIRSSISNYALGSSFSISSDEGLVLVSMPFGQ